MAKRPHDVTIYVRTTKRGATVDEAMRWNPGTGTLTNPGREGKRIGKRELIKIIIQLLESTVPVANAK